MNDLRIRQLFANYISNFERLNFSVINETYKWRIAKKFPELMDHALRLEGADFSAALYQVKKLSSNLIDAYTSPFQGLVEISRREPQTVKRMFLELYADDGGDLTVRKDKILAFLSQSKQLCDKYFPGSYRYRNELRSVMAYMFLYDPDHHYMYKATQANIFADCVEFYDNWGSGANFRLDVYYRFCDEIVAAIKSCPELLRTDAGRFDERFRSIAGQLHPDTEKHILAFDLIWCSSVHGLFQGMSFARPRMQERHLYAEKRAKAEELMELFSRLSQERTHYEEAVAYFTGLLSKGKTVRHKAFGTGIINNCENGRLVIDFPERGETRSLGMNISIANRIVATQDAGFADAVEKYRNALLRGSETMGRLNRVENELKAYAKYLDE